MDLKILTNKDSRKLHDDFAHFDLSYPGPDGFESFESLCERKLKERVLGSKKLISICLNAKANENSVSASVFNQIQFCESLDLIKFLIVISD